MANERCPSCGAVVPAGGPWCTLCWTDLRPPPPPAPPAPEPAVTIAAAPATAPVAAPVATLDPLADPLIAPLPGVPAAPAGATATWPCVRCGAANVLDLDVCGTCATPFGGAILRLDDPKEQRRRVLLLALAVVGAFLVVLAGLTFVMTKTPPAQPQPTTVVQ